MDFVTLGESHGTGFPLFPVFMLSNANWLLAVVLNLPHCFESGIDLLI